MLGHSLLCSINVQTIPLPLVMFEDPEHFLRLAHVTELVMASL